jgi:segregation and condensation protein A
MEGEHIAPPPRLSLAETVQELVGELERLQQTTFKSLVGPSPLPIEVVVRFLALLELYKRSFIDLEQPQAFEDIAVRWTGQAVAEPIEITEPPA